MKRSVFFLIAAVLFAAFGALMFFAPQVAAQAFALTASPGTDALFRILGATLLALGVMNFLVRNHPASETLKAVLWTDVATHGLVSTAVGFPASGAEQFQASAGVGGGRSRSAPSIAL
jgi:hypothetical protein